MRPRIAGWVEVVACAAAAGRVVTLASMDRAARGDFSRSFAAAAARLVLRGDAAFFADACRESDFAAARRSAAPFAALDEDALAEAGLAVVLVAADTLFPVRPAAPLVAVAAFETALPDPARALSAARRRPSPPEAVAALAGCRPRVPDPPFAAATFAAAARRMSFAERVLLDVDRATESLVRALSEAVGSYSLSAPMRQDDPSAEPPPPGILRRLAVAPIRAYRLIFAPWLGWHCRFHPSCSRYAEEAILRFGLLRGGLLMLWRLLRCQPLCEGGEDPVPERFSRAAFSPCRNRHPGEPA